MNRTQLLVHVTAPGTIQDDSRYRKLAKSIGNLRAASVSKIESRHTSCNAVTLQAQRVETLRRGPRSGESVPVTQPRQREPAIEQAAEPAPNRVRIVDGFDGEAVRRHVSYTLPKSVSGVCRDVLLKARYQFENEGHGLTLVTEPTRPKTAPEAQTRLLVPASSSRKRARSLSSSFRSATSYISDSQSGASVILEPPLWSASKLDQDGTDRFSIIVQSSSSAPSKARYAKSRCRRDMSRERSNQMAETAIGDRTGKYRSNYLNTRCSFARDRSLDWTSAENPSSANSASSRPSEESTTISPSQAVNRTFFGHRSSDCQSPMIGANMKHTIDLTSQDATNDSKTGGRELRESASSVDPSQRTDDIAIAGPLVPQATAAKIGTQLAIFTTRIESPEPTAGVARFGSHITETLRIVAERIPLERYFKPEYVARDVRVLERGYWQLDLRLADETTVTERRDVSEDCGHGDMEIPISATWTEHEFCDFWHNLSSFIQDGRAGWGIRAVIEQTDSTASLSEGETIVHVKIYTWGEVLGHVWLALWVLSDKLTAYIVMKWIASDGSTVVRMTGDRFRQGRLGPWTYKGPEGDKGCWSVASY